MLEKRSAAWGASAWGASPYSKAKLARENGTASPDFNSRCPPPPTPAMIGHGGSGNIDSI